MKLNALIACVGLLTLTACAQTNNSFHWKATIRAVNETGDPVIGAIATIGYYTNSASTTVEGMTDANGEYTFEHTAMSEFADVSFEAKKDGYYGISQQVNLQPPYDTAKWDIEKTLVLKKVSKPIAMYARLVDENPPTLGQPIGYDLMIGDWVCDGHKGISKDIIFQKWAYRKSGADYEYKVKITFPKDGDGIQVYDMPTSEVGSGLRSPHEAPLDGYQKELAKERSAHPGQAAKNDSDPNRIYLFRVRTVKNDDGIVVSAHYGKVYGDFMQFTYYLNPTPNDRNIEFDPKQNLLGGLQSFEQASAP
jgi:hypothetical protein